MRQRDNVEDCKTNEIQSLNMEGMFVDLQEGGNSGTDWRHGVISRETGMEIV